MATLRNLLSESNNQNITAAKTHGWRSTSVPGITDGTKFAIHPDHPGHVIGLKTSGDYYHAVPSDKGPKVIASGSWRYASSSNLKNHLDDFHAKKNEALDEAADHPYHTALVERGWVKNPNSGKTNSHYTHPKLPGEALSHQHSTGYWSHYKSNSMLRSDDKGKGNSTVSLINHLNAIYAKQKNESLTEANDSAQKKEFNAHLRSKTSSTTGGDHAHLTKDDNHHIIYSGHSDGPDQGFVGKHPSGYSHTMFDVSSNHDLGSVHSQIKTQNPHLSDADVKHAAKHIHRWGKAEQLWEGKTYRHDDEGDAKKALNIVRKKKAKDKRQVDEELKSSLVETVTKTIEGIREMFSGKAMTESDDHPQSVEDYTDIRDED